MPKQADHSNKLAATRAAGRARRGADVTLINPEETFVQRLRLHQIAAGQRVAAPELAKLCGRTSIADTYVSGPAGLVEERASGATSFPLSDAHGDVTTLTDDTGAVDSRLEYDPWGEQLLGPSQQFGWLGAQQRRTEAAMGFLQMGVRPYDPALGKFWSEDPILGMLGVSQTHNRYPYAGDNPVNWYDLDGRMVTPCGFTFGLIGCSDDLPFEAEDDPPKPGDLEHGGPSAELGCSLGAGPIGGHWVIHGENEDGSTYSGITPFVTPSFRASIGCAGMGWSGGHEGGGLSLTACFVACVGVSTDQGIGFGGGPIIGIDLSGPASLPIA